MLAQSATAAQATHLALVRAWRADLEVVHDALELAHEVLSSDIALLHHRLADDPSNELLVGRLPGVLTSAPEDSASSRRTVLADPGTVERAEPLYAAHRSLVRADRWSPWRAAVVLDRLEADLAAVADRRDAVAVRLVELRAALVRLLAVRSATALEAPA